MDINLNVVTLAIFAFVSFVNSVSAQCRECLPATLFAWDGERSVLGTLSPIATDRPDFTEASSTVGLGVAQLEMGYTYVRSSGANEHSWGEPLLRYGVLANWLELRAALSPISVSSNGTTSGTEDLYLGTKLWLMQQDDWLPELAVMPQMTVPTGSSQFTAGRVLAGVNLLYGWDIGETFSFAGSTQCNRAVDDVGAEYDEWAQSVTIGASLSEKTGSYVEWFAFFPSGGITAATQHYVNGGLTYSISDDIQFDLRIGQGLSEASDVYFAGAGISIRYY